MSKRNVLKSFLKDTNDGNSQRNLDKLFHGRHPLNEKDVLNNSDLAGGTMALVDP